MRQGGASPPQSHSKRKPKGNATRRGFPLPVAFKTKGNATRGKPLLVVFKTKGNATMRGFPLPAAFETEGNTFKTCG